MAEIKVKNLRPEFGVEVSGLEPRMPLDEETCRMLRKLFDERSLLVLRDMDIDVMFQTYLSEMLIGRDALAPGAAPPIENFFVYNKDPKSAAPFGRLLFHSDAMWVENGTRLLSLYGAEVEQPAIPTLFVSSGHAWDALPEDLRARVRGRAAVHCQDATDQRRGGAIEDVLVSTFDDIIKVTLPIAYPHPRTNRTLLYVCPQMTHSVAGLTWEESEDLLETLFDHLYAPKNILEHHWRQGDLVLWDNIAMQHARPNVSAEGPARKLRKTIAPTPRLDAARPQYRKVAEEA